MPSGTSVPALIMLFLVAGGPTACSDPATASKEAFAAALEPVVRDLYCRPVDVMPYEVKGEAGRTGFPLVTSPEPAMAGPGSDGTAVKALDALSAVGLVARATFEKPARRGSDGPFVRQPLVSYAPTATGAPFLRLVQRMATAGIVSVPSLCAAKGEIVDVLRWSEPVDFGGRRTSRVTYTYRGVEPIPIMPASEQARLAQPVERTTPVELASDGWRPITH